MRERTSLIHVINTHQNEKFQTLLEKTGLELPACYGLFWLLIEETTKSPDLKKSISEIPEFIPQEFIRQVIEVDLLKFDGEFLWSEFIQKKHEHRIKKNQERAEQLQALEQQNAKLKKEVERLTKLLKLRIKK